MLVEAIQNSFLLDKSQKEYLLNKIEKNDIKYIKLLSEIIENEKQFIISLLKKYKEYDNEYSIGQLKGELITKNFNKIKELEKLDKENEFDIDKHFSYFII